MISVRRQLIASVLSALLLVPSAVSAVGNAVTVNNTVSAAGGCDPDETHWQCHQMPASVAYS